MADPHTNGDKAARSAAAAGRKSMSAGAAGVNMMRAGRVELDSFGGGFLYCRRAFADGEQMMAAARSPSG
jgi:hypothetical protein